MKKDSLILVSVIMILMYIPAQLSAVFTDDIQNMGFFSSSAMDNYQVFEYANFQELVSNDTAWARFEHDHPGNWKVRINKISGIPHRVWGARILYSGLKSQDYESILKISRQFISNNGFLLRQQFNELSLLSCEKHGKIWYVHYDQILDGLKVYNSRTTLRIYQDGAVILFGTDYKPGIEIDLDPSIPAEEAVNIARNELGYQLINESEIEPVSLVYPRVNEEGEYQYRLVWKLELETLIPPGRWIYFVDAHTGEFHLKYNDYRFDNLEGNVTGWIKPRYYDDTSVEEEMSYIRVTYNSVNNNADVTGYYIFTGADNNPHPFSSVLQSPYVDVDYEDGADGSYSTSISSSASPFNFTWSTIYALSDEINVYYHTNFMHDFVKYTLNYDGMDYQMPATVRVGTNYDNAYWDGYGMNFGEGGSYFWNLGLFAEIIYHEYTHGVTHFIYPDGGLPYTGQSGAMDEGFSDYFACTITDEPEVGERCYRSSPTERMRTLENIHRFPYDFIGEVHHDGTIFGGALWDLREEIGNIITDSITHYARFGYPDNFEDYLPEILLADDDDGDLDNGTPHIVPIYENFHFHGIGPGYVFQFDHDPLPDSEDSLSNYPFNATIIHVIRMLPESTFVYYSTDEVIWNRTLLTYLGSDEFEGYIPPQPFGTTISYYLKSYDVSDAIAFAPESGPAAPYTFRVGLDTEAPMITHLPLPDQSQISWPAMVRCNVTDNLGLAEVNCKVRINSVDKPDLDLSRVDDTDEFRGYIDYRVEVGDIVEYRIEAIDASFAGNTSYFHPALYFSFEVLSYYFEPMEYDWVPYFSYNHTEGHPDTMQTYGDQWHLTGLRNNTSGGSQCWKCGAYDMTDYEDLLDAALVSPNLRLGVNSRLLFWQYMDAETSRAYSGRCYDGGIVEISTDDGESWEQIAPEGGYPFRIRPGSINGPFPEDTYCFSGFRDWQQLEFDLSWYTGYIKLRWRFGSDGAVAGEGWYIDDVTVESESVFVLDRDGVWKPAAVELYQNFPNPFNSRTCIYVHYEYADKAKLEIYDLLGNLVRDFEITPENSQPDHQIFWDGTNSNGEDVSSGIYLYKLNYGKHSESKKCLLIR